MSHDLSAHRDLTTSDSLALPSWPHWWPILLGPAVMGMVYAARATGFGWVFGRGVQDNSPLPYVLTLSAFAVAAIRAVAGRNPLMLLVAAMALAIFNREVHWEIVFANGRTFSPCSIIAYATLAASFVFAARRYDLIGPFFRRGRVAQWLIMTAATYIFAVAIAKGWIKHLVYDDRLVRTSLEETMENVAHLMLLMTTFTGRGASGPDPDPE